MQKDKQYYDEFFKKYGANAHYQPERFIKIAELCKGRVLDVGCGTGHLSDFYSGPYVGIDISDVAVAQAKEIRRKDAFFQVADVTKTRLEVQKKVDTVVIAEMLEHIDDDEFLFETLQQVLETNGIIIVSVPNGERVPDESHVRIFTVPEIRKRYSKYGKVSFHNWPGFDKRIIFTIERDKRSADLLSLVMTVKDEAKGLERAILSVIDLVDSITISVDTKTIDKTEEIAKLYADKIKHHEWQNDFSKARNEAHAEETSKYILFLDGHEYAQSFGDVKNKLLTDVDGIFVKIRMESGFEFLYPRIYKNGLQFQKPVHNLIECKTKLVEPNFVIVHDRDNGQDEASVMRRNKQREEMLPKAMRQALKEDKKNLRALLHLGNYYMMRKDWKQAIKFYKKYIKYAKHPEELYLVVINKGNCEIMLGRHIRALWSFDKADKLLPGRWETARMIGGLYVAKGQYEKALKWLIQALDGNKKHHLYHPFQYDASELWDLIGHCFNKQGNNAKAVIAWKQAEERTDNEQRKKFFAMKAKYAEMLCKGSNEAGTLPEVSAETRRS